jgi:PP-loop superfamily ATP-utilizing enzyme
MKKKLSIVNLVLMIAVLFSILGQSIHSYEHIVKQFSEKKCEHKYTSAAEITHQHHTYDSCYLCSFAVSSFVYSDIKSFELYELVVNTNNSVAISKEITQFFKGSLFALRAPPLV